MNISPPTRFYALSFLVKALRESLLAGKWIEVLPPERELSEQLQVSRSTLRKALRILEEDGFIVISQGRPTLITVPVSIGVQPISHRLRLFQTHLEDGLRDFTTERMLLDIKYRLHAAGIECEEVNMASQAARGQPSWKQPEIESDGAKVLNVLFGVDPASERWFFKHAPHATLLVGQGDPEFGLPSVDVDLEAIGTHIGSLAVQRGFQEIFVLSDEEDTVRARYVHMGMEKVLKDDGRKVSFSNLETERLPVVLPNLFRKLAGGVNSLLVVNSPDMVPAILYHAGRESFFIPRDFSMLATIGCPDLKGYGMNLAFYDYQVARVAKAVVQQIIDVIHIDGLKFQRNLFIPNFFPGDTLAPAGGAPVAKRNAS